MYSKYSGDFELAPNFKGSFNCDANVIPTMQRIAALKESSWGPGGDPNRLKSQPKMHVQKGK